MPTVTLQFDLETEEPNMRDAINGYRWRAIVQELEQELKYFEGTPYEVRRKLNDLVADWGLELFD